VCVNGLSTVGIDIEVRAMEMAREKVNEQDRVRKFERDGGRETEWDEEETRDVAGAIIQFPSKSVSTNI